MDRLFELTITDKNGKTVKARCAVGGISEGVEVTPEIIVQHHKNINAFPGHREMKAVELSGDDGVEVPKTLNEAIRMHNQELAKKLSRPGKAILNTEADGTAPATRPHLTAANLKPAPIAAAGAGEPVSPGPAEKGPKGT